MVVIDYPDKVNLFFDMNVSPATKVAHAAPRLLAVSTGDMASIRVLKELFTWLNNLESSDCRFAGIIINNTKNMVQELIVNDFASRTGT